jgi:hypothetical protein
LRARAQRHSLDFDEVEAPFDVLSVAGEAIYAR